MGGIVRFTSPAPSMDANVSVGEYLDAYTDEMVLAKRIVKSIRTAAAKQDVKVPKNISVNGGWGEITIGYTTNALRHIIEAELRRRKLAIVP